MSSIDVPLKNGGFGSTMRKDAWWVEPLLVFLSYLAFIVYANYAILQNGYYELPGTGYLSPMYSPLLFRNAPSWWPALIPYSAAWFILWVPLGFRFTCYYYRGAYYKAFWADPPSCTVGEPRKRYRGERSFPLILQNVHRYFLYLALIFLVLLAHDVWKALWFINPVTGQAHFGLGLGTIVLAVNVVLLAGYTFGCHSLRHLVGGCLDQLSKSPLRQKSYGCVGGLNRRHMLWAWMSLFSVMFADLYVRLCSMGIWSDWRIF
jgi:hypothetical protein